METVKLINTVPEMRTYLWDGFTMKFEDYTAYEKPLIALHVYWGNNFIEEYPDTFAVDIEGDWISGSKDECEKALEDWFILNADLIGYTAQKYVVKHPNFDEYLKLLYERVQLFYSIDEVVKTHEWVKDKTQATHFNSKEEARGNYTSPLCDTLPA